MGTWQNRTLNAKTDPKSFVILDSGNVYFTLPAGSYEIKWDTPAYMVGNFQSRLQYDDNSSFSSPTSVLGSTEHAPTNAGVLNAQLSSTGIAVFTVSENTYVRIQIQASGTPGDANALGKASNIDTEIYTQVTVEDLATAVKEPTISNNVWHVQKTNNQTITGTPAWQDISGLSQTVSSPTPSTKFLITATVNASMAGTGHDGLVRLMRGTTPIGSTSSEAGSSPSGNITGFGQVSGQNSQHEANNLSITYLDTPGAGSHTYHIEGRNNDSSVAMVINRRGLNEDFYLVSHMSIQQFS